MTAQTEERLAQIMAQVEEFPEGSVERCEALAFTFLTLARAQWRKADRIRSRQQAERARPACDGSLTIPAQLTDSGDGQCGTCGGTFMVRVDGTLRRHRRWATR